MSSISNRINSVARRILRITVTSLIAFAFTACIAQTIPAQCSDHPENKTALRFNNESSHELTFFVDDDEKGVTVPSRTVSVESQVEPGEHVLRARAIVRGESFWVWVVNEVPRGQICTWTVEDSPRETARADSKYRSTIDARPKNKNTKHKRQQ